MDSLSIDYGLVFPIHMVFTLLMVGVIWIVQLVHYPSFEFIDESRFPEFSRFHQKQISYIVAPLMLLELVSGILLISFELNTFSLFNMLGIFLLWFITFFYFMPLHEQLSEGKDSIKIKNLVYWNWVRTFLWSVRGIYLIVLVTNR